MLAQELKKISAIILLAKKAFGEYKLQILALSVLGFLSGLLEAVGINALIPLFSYATGQAGAELDAISRYIGKAFELFHISPGVKYLLVFISLLFVAKALVLIFFTYVSSRITAGYEEKTRNALFEKTFAAGWPYLLKQKLGHLQTLLTININYSSRLLDAISSTIMVLLTLVVYSLVAINISPYITLVALVLGMSLFIIFKPLIYRVRKLAYESDEINKGTSHFVNENVSGIKTVKALEAGNSIAEAGKPYFARLKSIQIKLALVSAMNSSLMQPAGLIFICFVFAFSYKSPGFNFAALAAVIYLIKQIFSYFEQLQKNLLSLNNYFPYLKSILDYQEETFDFKEEEGGSLAFVFEKELEFKNVGFSYDTGEKVLSGVSFKLAKGEMAGLIGPSGAGKTTIVDLALRLFNPDNGEILLDGKNIPDISMREWRRNIGYVSQDIFLKNDTIAENIRFYDKTITDNDIEEAAKMANIYDFVQTCPEKFSTVIGERGVMLSGGQRQRIVIARMLARKPQILILDEATSALDNESEAQIQKVIENLKGKVTVLAVAHRLSTINNSDKLLVLDKGRIAEEGAPEELLKNKESYFFKVTNLKP